MGFFSNFFNDISSRCAERKERRLKNKIALESIAKESNYRVGVDLVNMSNLHKEYMRSMNEFSSSYVDLHAVIPVYVPKRKRIVLKNKRIPLANLTSLYDSKSSIESILNSTNSGPYSLRGDGNMQKEGVDSSIDDIADQVDLNNPYKESYKGVSGNSKFRSENKAYSALLDNYISNHSEYLDSKNQALTKISQILSGKSKRVFADGTEKRIYTWKDRLNEVNSIVNQNRDLLESSDYEDLKYIISTNSYLKSRQKSIYDVIINEVF